MKKLIYFIFLGIFLMSMVSSAQTHLGTFKQDSCIDLLQTCSSCSYNNITSIQYPNGTREVFSPEQNMTKEGTEFLFNTCDYSSEIGNYKVNGHGDLSGVNTIWNYEYEITKSGNENPKDTQYLFLISVGSMIFLSLLFFFISSKFKDGENENHALKFGFIAFSLILGIIAALFSYISIDEFYSGFDRIMDSYYIFVYVVLAILFILFIFILINLFVKALDSVKIRKGLK